MGDAASAKVMVNMYHVPVIPSGAIATAFKSGDRVQIEGGVAADVVRELNRTPESYARQRRNVKGTALAVR